MPDKFGAVCYVPGDYKITKGTASEINEERFRLEKAIGIIEACIGDGDAQIKFKSNVDLVGVADGTPVEVEIVIANGMGVPNPLSQITDEVTVVVLSGSGVIAEPQPVKFVRKEVNAFRLEYVARVNVSATAPNSTKLGLQDSGGSKLLVSDELNIAFS